MKELQGTYTRLFCKYDQLSAIYNDSMVVYDEINNLYGAVDASGRELTTCQYKEMHPYSEDGYALVLGTMIPMHILTGTDWPERLRMRDIRIWDF